MATSTRGGIHPWHDIPVDPLIIAEQIPAIIEIPAGSKNKYELDKKFGVLRLDRVLHSSVHYPANYGFIPRSFCDDGDPLDVLVLGQEPIDPLTMVDVRPVGVMRMLDSGKTDDKVLAVHINDPEFTHVYRLADITPHRISEISRFFIDYKVLEEKEVTVNPFQDRERALEIIAQALVDYENSFGLAD